MAIKNEEVTQVNIVLDGLELLRSDKEINELRNTYADAKLDGQLGRLNAQTSSLTQGRLVSLPRQRISMHLFPSQSIIRRDYPESDEDLGYLARLAAHAVQITGKEEQTLESFGVEVELNYHQDSGETVLKYLSERLFPNGLTLPIPDVNLEGALVKLVYRDDESLLRVALNPYLGEVETSRIALSIGVAKDTDQVPTVDELTELLKKARKLAKDYPPFLDNRSA